MWQDYPVLGWKLSSNFPDTITRQNDAANLLANKGYDVEMLPETIRGNGYGINTQSNPDF